MYERFTDRARKVMQLASRSAQSYQHEFLGTEHILLGLIEDGSGVAANVLKSLNISPSQVRHEVEKIVQRGPRQVASDRVPQTPRAKKVIEYAIAEARDLRHTYVGTEHLLLGLCREEEGVAAQILLNLGLNLSVIRAEVQQFLGVVPDEPVRMGLPPGPAIPAQPPAPGRPSRIGQAVYHLDTVVDLLRELREEAVEVADFQWAASLRDNAENLLRMKDWLVRERGREGPNRS